MESPLQIKISDRKQGPAYAVEVGGYGFYWNPLIIRQSSLGELGRMHPADAGFVAAATPESQKALQEAETIEIELPGNEIAALDWEALSRGNLIRINPAQSQTPFARPKFPIRMGIFTVEGERGSAGLVRTLSESLQRDIERGRIKIEVVKTRSRNELFRALQKSRYDVIHIALPTTMRGRRPCVLVGKEEIPTRALFQNALVPGPRLAFFHAATENVAEGISGLRIASQAVENLGTTCVLHAAPLEDPKSHQFVVRAFEGALIDDRDLIVGIDKGIELDPDASIAAPVGRRSFLGLRPELDSELAGAEVLLADYKNIEKQYPEIKVDLGLKINISPDEPSEAIRSGKEYIIVGETERSEEPTVLSKWADVAETRTTIEKAIGTVLRARKSKINKPGRERFPVGNFYHCVDDSEQGWDALPKNRTLTKPPNGRRLEFHFWIDPINQGIRTIYAGTFSPKTAIYPIKLVAQVWTESSARFVNDTSSLIIPATGRSNHARFVLNEIPVHEDIEFFLFLTHEQGQLIAAFRVHARFRETSEIDNEAQLIEQMFGSSDYFRFREKPGVSALTILFDKHAGQLRVFTLAPKARPWAKLGIAEDDLNGSNREIYKQLTRVALDAATAERLGESVRITDKTLLDLAEKGWVLLQDLFSVAAEEQARTFLKTVLMLPEGSRITIATNEQTSRMIVPWGLLYLNNEFRQAPFHPVSVDSFLGYKYNVVVRPSIPLGPTEVESGKPVRMATAWLSRPETEELKKKLDEAKSENRLEYRQLKADEGRIPGLEEQFDLIHFYCHGHTRFPDEFKPQEFLQLFKEHIPVSRDAAVQPTITELADFLQKVTDANDSLMQLDGGFVYRADLSSDLARLNGSPIVLLSMCESAQVSSSGVGFIPFFLGRGARAAMGTEGPTLWSLGRELDLGIITRLLAGETIGEAFYAAKREVVRKNPLGLIYSLWGERDAKIVGSAV